jgi:FkbM family methyltransferase
VDNSSPQFRIHLQALADAAIPRNHLLAGLTDQAVVERLIAPYFALLPTVPAMRHVVDVGAAYGSVAAVFLRNGWTADLFEPDPACRQFLATLVAGFPGRCRLFPFAAGAEDRAAVPFQQNATPGLSGFDASPFGSPRSVLQVRCVRLETFLASLGTARVDFLKIDTEGRDFEVLETHDFVRFPPALVLVEYGYHFRAQGPAELASGIAWMAARGYRPVIFEYDDDGNFQRGNWAHRLIAMHFDATRVPTRARSFGNVLFHRDGDRHLIEVMTMLLQTPD